MTSIHVTTGPSMRTPETLRSAIALGARGFRFPASKAPLNHLAERAQSAARAADLHGVTIDLLLDLPGRKTQLHCEADVPLHEHARIRILYGGKQQAISAPDQRSDPPTVVLSGASHLTPLDPGQLLLLGDGEDCLEVVSATADFCDATPLTRGVLRSKHGVVLPGRPMGPSGATDADLQTLTDPASGVFTGILVSFTETSGDLLRIRRALRHRRNGAPMPAIIAKVETQAGAEHIDAIAAEADGIVLGRGDLLMNTGPVEFPDVCARIIERTARAGTLLIVGTQLLTSMNESWLPGRSELAYLAHLVQDGVGGLLLSDETTIGPDPCRTIGLLAEVIGRYGSLGEALFS